MFSKFNFFIDEENFFRKMSDYKDCNDTELFEMYYNIGLRQFSCYSKVFNKSIEKYLDAEKAIDISELEEDWFNNKELEADVFISHSHKDKDLAIAFAGVLNYEFKLKTFIDSCVWGDSNELLRSMDEKYSRLNEDVPNEYYYKDTLITSSHVHMVLASALMKMINKTECFIFLNTDNSTISVIEEMSKVEDERTYSPWIYLEINTANLLNIIPPKREVFEKEAFNESVKSKFPIDMSSFIYSINEDLINWKNAYEDNKDINSLDLLYKLNNGMF